jgi:hypothetical protein
MGGVDHQNLSSLVVHGFFCFVLIHFKMLGQMRREEGCGKVYKLVQSALGTLCSYNLTMVFINQTNNQIYVQNHKNPTILFFSHFLSPLVRSVTDCVQLGVAVSKRRTDDQGRLQRN